MPSADPGLDLRLWAWGRDDPPLVFLHGYGMSARVWDPIVPALTPRRVLALDARGHGDSDADPANEDLYATGLSDLCALVEREALGRVSLVGHSMGAFVAMSYCARHPERVARLVMLDAGPDLPAGRRVRPRPTPRRTPPVTGFESERAYADALGVMYPRAAPELLRELAPHWLRRRPDGRYELKLDPGLVRRGTSRPTSEPSREARQQRERLWRLFARVRCPLLIVRGEHSTVLSEVTARRMREVAPDARLVELGGAGHALMLDAPDALRAALVDFLVAHPVPSNS